MFIICSAVLALRMRTVNGRWKVDAARRAWSQTFDKMPSYTENNRDALN